MSSMHLNCNASSAIDRDSGGSHAPLPGRTHAEGKIYRGCVQHLTKRVGSLEPIGDHSPIL